MSCRVIAALLLLHELPALAQLRDKTLVASGQGIWITVGQFTAEMNYRTLKLRTQEFLARQKILDDLIDRSVLEAEAKDTKKTVPILIEENAVKSIRPLSTEDIKLAYTITAKSDTDVPTDAILKELGDRMRGQKAAAAKQAYIDSLRQKFGVKLWLEPPRATFPASGKLFPEGQPTRR